MSKSKSLCDWSKKDFRERWDELRELVESPKYACTKCGRAAAKKSVLCKAQLVGKSKPTGEDSKGS